MSTCIYICFKPQLVSNGFLPWLIIKGDRMIRIDSSVSIPFTVTVVLVTALSCIFCLSSLLLCQSPDFVTLSSLSSLRSQPPTCCHGLLKLTTTNQYNQNVKQIIGKLEHNMIKISTLSILSWNYYNLLFVWDYSDYAYKYWLENVKFSKDRRLFFISFFKTFYTKRNTLIFHP